jgi:DNA polymerase (family 10)
MSGPNDVVAALLREHADLIRTTGGAAAESRSYERAARAVGTHVGDVCDLGIEDLARVPGISRPIAAEILDFLDTGHVEAMDVLRLRAGEGTFVPSGGGY